ncbi:hypothetical protein GGU11DRAFT_279196 [Lentinula aff. detonsa]|nr:hypothetical protein GGU11DRAFT_279196 [Lentinula aff. detonsa]
MLLESGTEVPLRALNFTSHKGASGAFEFPHITCVATGEPLHLKTHKVPVYNLREIKSKPSIDVNSYTWENLPFPDLEGSEGWEDRYGSFTCEWLKNYLGARSCRLINHQIRRKHSDGDVSDNYESREEIKDQQPVPAVHVDINRERASARALAVLGEEFSDSDRLAIINIWRPLRGPVIDAPLALCDARTLDAADMERTTDSYGGGYFIKYNTNMKWVYIHDQMPDEILLFRQYDNTLEPELGDAKCIAHTAFLDDLRDGQGLPRQSIELRCAVAY